MQPSPTHQSLIDRFVAACDADERVVAAFLGGSYASGTADAHSDVDLGVVTTDAGHEDFAAAKYEFVRKLGEALFLEDFGSARHAFAIFADGTECDMTLARGGAFADMHEGPYRALIDKRGLLDGVVFPWKESDPSQRTEVVRRQVAWFWHDFGHLVKALARGELWFAQGELEILRGVCVNLARLKHNPADPYVGQEPYFKLERALPPQRLDPLRVTLGPLERESLVRSARAVLGFYRELARELARTHGLDYPAQLDALFTQRLDELS